VALVVAVVAVIAGGVGVVALRADDDGDTKAGDAASSDDEVLVPGKAEEASGDPGAYVDRDTGFEITVPDSWTYADLTGDVSDAGRKMFPDDPRKASIAQARIQAVPRALVFIAVVADEFGRTGFNTNLNVTSQDAPRGVPSYQAFVSGLKQGMRGSGASHVVAKPFDLLGGTGVRVDFDYDLPALKGSGIAYAALVDRKVWTLTLSAPSDEMGDRADEFDQILASFRVID
jgi:hypothetical protein